MTKRISPFTAPGSGNQAKAHVYFFTSGTPSTGALYQVSPGLNTADTIKYTIANDQGVVSSDQRPLYVAESVTSLWAATRTGGTDASPTWSSSVACVLISDQGPAASGPAVAQGLPLYAGSRTRSYDPFSHVYGGDAATRRPIRAALGKALAGTSLVPLMCMGDSETAGWKATPGTNDPVMQLRKLFAAAGFPVTGGWVFPGNGTTSALDNRWAFTGPWQGANSTVSNYMWVASTGATATFTPDLPGTVMEFVVFSTATLTINYAIDGGASTPFVVNAGAARKVQVTGLSNAQHTLVITTTSGTTVWVGAARLRQTTGLSISNAGIFGAYASDWLPSALASAYFNPYNLTLGLETPALVLLGLGANEAIHSGHTVSALTSTLTTILQGVQALCPVVMKTYMPSDDSVVSAANPGTVWTDWVKGMYDTADTTGTMLIDHTDAMGSNAQCAALGLADADKIHPTAAGYSVVARRDFLGIAA